VAALELFRHPPLWSNSPFIVAIQSAANAPEVLAMLRKIAAIKFAFIDMLV